MFCSLMIGGLSAIFVIIINIQSFNFIGGIVSFLIISVIGGLAIQILHGMLFSLRNKLESDVLLKKEAPCKCCGTLIFPATDIAMNGYCRKAACVAAFNFEQGSNDKLPCNRCGNLILPETLRDTNGYCRSPDCVRERGFENKP